MICNFFIKLTGLVLIVTAHKVLNVASHTDVIGMLGKDVTLQFIFNCSECNITKNRYFGVYTTGEHKISEYPHCKCLNIYPKNYTVLYNIKNLTMNHSKIYWISLFDDHKPPTLSNKVKLIIQEDNNTSVPPVTTHSTTPPSHGSSSHVVILLVVTPVALFAVVLLFSICCLLRTRDRGDDSPQRLSNPTVQEVIEDYSTLPGPSVIYSVLDFPKRPPTVVEFDPNDTEYAHVSYTPDHRDAPHRAPCKPDSTWCQM
ncbi:uncharacterized protein LOC112150336 isoform X2 [Oryzias melastigma]|uniref:uncharacterized protein LOC112150336 isoform X2 n=1 Tax=Oryzias melastigma TaxID=30732 RepID=UPI00168CFAB2|nr:uncharacterized protein LOC112150336 isoform X2 [Oryzias melastigma]